MSLGRAAEQAEEAAQIRRRFRDMTGPHADNAELGDFARSADGRVWRVVELLKDESGRPAGIRLEVQEP